MASNLQPQVDQDNHDLLPDPEVEPFGMQNGDITDDSRRQSPSESKTPEPRPEQQSAGSDTPSTPGQLPPFDWEDFEARYEQALRDADQEEEAMLQNAEKLSGVSSHSWPFQAG